MPTTAEFSIIHELSELKARYCRLLDAKDWEPWSELFAEDGVMDASDDANPEIGPSAMRGRQTIVNTVRNIVGAGRTMHQVHSPEFLSLGSNEAKAIWAMHDVLLWPEGVASPLQGKRYLEGFGHYHDTYTRREGRWYIASLKLTRLLTRSS